MGSRKAENKSKLQSIFLTQHAFVVAIKVFQNSNNYFKGKFIEEKENNNRTDCNLKKNDIAVKQASLLKQLDYKKSLQCAYETNSHV